MSKNDSRKCNGNSKKDSTKRKNKITLKDELAENGLVVGHLSDLLLYNFDSLLEASEYFGCTEQTLKRWMETKNWQVPVARLLLIKHRGFLPPTREWRGYKIRGDELITPYGKAIKAQDLQLFQLSFGVKDREPMAYLKGENAIEARM